MRAETVFEHFGTREFRVTRDTLEYKAEVPFIGIMRNFAGAVNGDDGSYLTGDDLLLNTMAGTALHDSNDPVEFVTL